MSTGEAFQEIVAGEVPPWFAKAMTEAAHADGITKLVKEEGEHARRYLKPSGTIEDRGNNLPSGCDD